MDWITGAPPFGAKKAFRRDICRTANSACQSVKHNGTVCKMTSMICREDLV